MGLEVYLLVILVFIIIAALVAVETRNLLSAVISLGAVGFGLSIIFLMLLAPDLAIVQIAVEVVLLIFFIRATIGRDVLPESGIVKPSVAVIGVVAVVALFIVGMYAFRTFKPFGTPVMEVISNAPSGIYLEEGLRQTGSGNIVTSVLLDYRAYDTLGEATVLFTAILGALTILRGRARSQGSKKNEGDDSHS